MRTTDITVVGCGRMGAAMAQAIAAASYDVTVWNRTHEKAMAVQSERVTPLESLQEAVDASPRVLVIVSSNGDALEVLRETSGWEGKALVNAGTSIPDEVDSFHDWAGAVGARYLDGAMLAYPADIGTESGGALFSGPLDVWEDCKDILATLGAHVVHVSEDVKGACVLDVAAVGAFYTAATSAYLEAAAYAKVCGIPPSKLLAVSEPLLEILRSSMHNATDALASDRYESDQVTIATYAVGMRSFLRTMRDAGQHARHVEAAVAGLDAAESAGYQDLGLFSLARVASVEA
jgi:3-hydroxyisobutyrate dehydrogenase-like beta-hydroxyacid dehydrogenase